MSRLGSVLRRPGVFVVLMRGSDGLVGVPGHGGFGRSVLVGFGREDQRGDAPLLDRAHDETGCQSGKDGSEEDSLEQLHRCLAGSRRNGFFTW